MASVLKLKLASRPIITIEDQKDKEQLSPAQYGLGAGASNVALNVRS